MTGLYLIAAVQPENCNRLQRVGSGSRADKEADFLGCRELKDSLPPGCFPTLSNGPTAAVAEHRFHASGNRRIGSSGFRQTASPMQSRETTEIQIRVAFAFMGVAGADDDGQREAQTIHR